MCIDKILDYDFIIHTIPICINFIDQEKKMLFVTIWFSFAVSLFILNTQKKRQAYYTIPYFDFWKWIILVVTGMIGGKPFQDSFWTAYVFFLSVPTPISFALRQI